MNSNRIVTKEETNAKTEENLVKKEAGLNALYMALYEGKKFVDEENIFKNKDSIIMSDDLSRIIDTNTLSGFTPLSILTKARKWDTIKHWMSANESAKLNLNEVMPPETGKIFRNIFEFTALTYKGPDFCEILKDESDSSALIFSAISC